MQWFSNLMNSYFIPTKTWRTYQMLKQKPAHVNRHSPWVSESSDDIVYCRWWVFVVFFSEILSQLLDEVCHRLVNLAHLHIQEPLPGTKIRIAHHYLWFLFMFYTESQPFWNQLYFGVPNVQALSKLFIHWKQFAK